MTGQQLLDALKALTPEQLALPTVLWVEACRRTVSGLEPDLSERYLFVRVAVPEE